MKFTNAELTARMISAQKNGWPFCPRCGKQTVHRETR